jgi:hypothetical protein
MNEEKRKEEHIRNKKITIKKKERGKGRKKYESNN